MKEILAQIKQYKKDSILTPVFTALEVFMEMLLPFIMAKIIDDGLSCRKICGFGFIRLCLQSS